jgi:acetolactate synthase-1/2/3 large subunit
MGFALPASIAADLLNTGNKIYAIAGDGGFLMNLQEMETAKRLGVNIVVIIWEDRSYGLIKWKQQVQFGENTDLDFTNPDWKLLAESFGWNYIFEDESSQLILTLKKIKKLKGPTLLIIPIDYSENLKLTQKLNDLEVE